MKVSLSILFVLLGAPFYNFGQTEPYDTAYYENGVIKRIRFNRDRHYNGAPGEVYYRKYPIEGDCFNGRIIDTMWAKGHFSTRLYYTNGLMLYMWHNNRQKRNYYKPDIWIYRSYQPYSQDTLFVDMLQLMINDTKHPLKPFFTFHYNKDTIPRGIGIDIVDSINLVINNHFITIPFKAGIPFGNDNSFQIGEYGLAGLEYNNNGRLNMAGFRTKEINPLENKLWLVYFNKDLFIDSVYTKKDSDSIWNITYYHKYSSIETLKGQLIILESSRIKTGWWYGYDHEGKLIRKEWWKNGKLEKFEEY